MAGVTLSRWTMAYFAMALLALLAAEVLMTAGYGYPQVPVGAPATLVLVHLVVLGWLSLLLCGAMFQFVPVLVAKPLYSMWLCLPVLGLLVAGLIMLLSGFLSLGGVIEPVLPFFALASGLLVAGFVLVLWDIGLTLWNARPLALPARFIVIGIASLAATVSFGAIFALLLGGVAGGFTISRLLVYGLPLHVIAGLAGWLTLTAMGVSYRLLAMFMLAPEQERVSSRAAFWLGTAALAVVVFGGSAAIVMNRAPWWMLLVGALLGLAAVALYVHDMMHLYHARKRRKIELNSTMAMVALAFLVAVALLIVVLLGMGQLTHHIAAVVFLGAFGWLSGLGLAMLYKIVPFLTWLECYGPVLGKGVTPRVQDLVEERRARKWFVLYFLGILGALATLLLGASIGFRIAAALMLVATVGIIVQLVRARRLDDVPSSVRFPAGSHRPRLLMALIQPR